MKALVAVAMLVVVAGCSRKPEAPAESKENAAKGPRTFQMKKAAQAQVGVVLAPATVTSLREYLTVTGTVQPVDSRVAHVSPIARGRIQETLVRVGDRVRAG